MNAEETALRIDLIAPSIWRSAEAAAYHSLSEGERRLAVSALTTLHERHAGLTPGLAASLAQTLLARAPGAYPEPWHSVNERLRWALEGLAGVDARAAAEMNAAAFQLRLNLSFAYLVLHVALPLCQAASRQIGQTCLFAEEELAESPDATEYARYAANLEKHMADLVAPLASLLPDLFWQERALALAGMARVRPGQRHGRVKPTLYPPELAVFLRLNPPLTPRRLTMRRPLIRLENPDVRTRRLPDAGSDGVHVSHDPADLHRMMLSEWHYPDEVWLDRLVNEGFMASHRPPRRVRLRDALIVGLLPGEVAVSPVGSFIKACWFEMLYPLSRLLRLGGLNRSELRWIEGDSAGRVSSRSMLLDALPAAATAADGEAVVAAPALGRHAFRVGSGWLPAYLDDHVLFDAAPAGAVAPPGAAGALEQWFYRAWRAQRENPAWHRPQTARYDQTAARDRAAGLGPQEYGALDVAGYAFVHVNLFAPAGPGGAANGDDLATLARLRLLLGGGDRPIHFSLTSAPQRVDRVTRTDPAPRADQARDHGVWSYQDGRPDHADLLGPDEAPTARAVAAALIDRWLATIIRELTYA